MLDENKTLGRTPFIINLSYQLQIIAIGMMILAGCVENNESRKPNILYIFTDDQSDRTVSSYGNAYPWVNTPNIDKLASQGVKFKYCYTGAKCVPSRGNALTGMLQHNYDRSTEYWPAEFRRQGYYTGMIGKWHWDVPRHETTWDWSAVWEHHLPGNMTNYYWDQSLRMQGDSLLPLDEYSTDAYTRFTVDFIKERSLEKDQPWYFWLCYGAVHGPYTPADRHIGSYEDAPEMEYPKDIYGPRPDKPDHVVHLETNKKDPVTGKPMYRKRTLDSFVKQYNEAVSAIDQGVGKVIQALRETDQLNNTLVIFTSDQGYAWGHHGYNLKVAPYDANLLAPLIISQPGTIPQNIQSDIPVNGVDLIKTIHSFCDVVSARTLDGRDLSSIVYDPASVNWKDSVMVQIYTGRNYGNERIRTELEKAQASGDWESFTVHPKTGTKAWMMLRKGKYKYVRYIYKDYIEELYDLETDPEELVNLAVKEQHRQLLRDMRQELIEEFAKKGAIFLDILPEPMEKSI